MTDRPHKADAVTDFLQRTLADGALDVTQLEAMAEHGVARETTTNHACQSIQKGEKAPWNTISSGWVWKQGKVGMASAGEASQVRQEGGGLYKGCEHLRASSFSIVFERLARGAIQRPHPSSLD